MKNLKLILIVLVVALLAAGGAGAAVWWKFGRSHGDADPSAEHAPEPKPAPDYKYVSLDKVLIMLRGGNGEAVSHYLAMDLVFKAPPEQEKAAKEHLPMLRAVAVRALSAYTMEAAQAMSVEQFAEALNKAFKQAYAEERHKAPFDEVLIGKLIIE